MFTNDLLKKILIEPLSKGANHLYIVSGYATATMVVYHMDEIQKKPLFLSLIIGMCSEEGLSLSNHNAFKNLMDDKFCDKFKCSYYIGKTPVHSKVYSWFADDKPITGYIGSANYTQNSFKGKKQEAMTFCDPLKAFEYYETLESETIFCNHQDAECKIKIFNDREYFKRRSKSIAEGEEETEDKDDFSTTGLPHVNVSLLCANGKIIHTVSGLNWGQRKGREPNQAYIPLIAKVNKSDFFPKRPIHFTVLTDDGITLICRRASDSEKAILTPHNNSLIGEYFRKRIGVDSGVFVKKSDLENYGRTSVDFYKIDEETFYMDFST